MKQVQMSPTKSLINTHVPFDEVFPRQLSSSQL